MGDTATLLDWAFVGDGALGEDIGNLLPDTAFELFGAYVDGLHEAGWAGDEREVRLAVCASAAKYAWIPADMVRRSLDEEQRTYGDTQPASTERLFSARADVMRFLCGWAREARALAVLLGR